MKLSFSPHNLPLLMVSVVAVIICPFSSVEAMNKAELIDAVASNIGYLSKADAKRALDAFEQCTATYLKKQKSVSLPGFGTLYQYTKKRPSEYLDPDDDNDGFCDGLDNDCDFVLNDKKGADGWDWDFVCPADPNGSDNDCDGYTGDEDGLALEYNDEDDDCDGSIDFSIDKEAMEGELDVLRAEEYWIDVIRALSTSLATDHNSSRSNKSSSNRKRKQRNLLRALADEPGQMQQNDPEKGKESIYYKGTKMSAMSYWIGEVDKALRDPPGKDDGASQGKAAPASLTLQGRMRTSAKKFVEANYEGPEKELEKIAKDLEYYWALAIEGAPRIWPLEGYWPTTQDDNRSLSAMSMDESDQLPILDCMKKTLHGGAGGGGVVRVFDHANLAKILLTLQNEMLRLLTKYTIFTLDGFGTFSISRRAARTGRNPQTGKEIKISAVAAKNVVKFKAGKALSETVN